MISIESFNRSAVACRALLEERLTPRARRRLASPSTSYPELGVLPEDRARVQAAYGHRCAYCDIALPVEEGLTIDFLVPRARGGTIEVDNLVASCEPCLCERADDHLDRFLQRSLHLDARAVRARIVHASATLRAGAWTDRGRA